jgi:hypothetical protein
VSLLSYSIAVDKAPAMQYEQADAFQTTRAGDWPVWLIWQVPAALRLAAVKTIPQNCLLVPGTSWLQSSFSMHHTRTPVPSFLSSAHLLTSLVLL